MRGARARLTVFGILAAVGICLFGVAAEEHPPIWRYSGPLASGIWEYSFSGLEFVLVDDTPINGFAFAPGRKEVAYCGPAGEHGRPGLWVVSALPEYAPERPWFASQEASTARPRLLWTAPEGTTLTGPIWWAPDGSTIALRTLASDGRGVAAVDYATGDVRWVVRGADVADVRWHPRGGTLAYVAADEVGPAVWLRALLSAEAQRLGEGGFNLRWSADGNSLSWLRQASEDGWLELVWDAESGETESTGEVPSPPEEALFSPAGSQYAFLTAPEEGEERAVVISATRSPRHERLDLPALCASDLLGWSPDGHVLVVQGDMGYAVAISTVPPRLSTSDLVDYPNCLKERERAAVLAVPIDERAGAPSWSSGCDMIAYVVAEEFDPASGLMPIPGSGTKVEDLHPLGRFVVSEVKREYRPPVPGVREEVVHVMANLAKIGNCLQMYLADNNDTFPMAGEVDQLRITLGDYVSYMWDDSVYMRPGSEDDLVVDYLAEPGARLAEVEDWEDMPVASVRYLPDFDVVLYADGRVELVKKQ